MRSEMLVIDTVVSLTLAKWETLSGQFGGNLTSYYREPSGEAAWEMFSTNYGPTRSLATSLDESRKADLRRDFIEFHEKFRNEVGICVPRNYLLTLGVRR